MKQAPPPLPFFEFGFKIFKIHLEYSYVEALSWFPFSNLSSILQTRTVCNTLLWFSFLFVMKAKVRYARSPAACASRSTRIMGAPLLVAELRQLP